ncbi:hypothetical protein INP83_20350 [Mucilaginibacter sp. 21P]|uniref:hypothetical protein n=1 Tax=Mucilaginibacter sp. 21P TaxID=2778902 RepID=UPI001C5966DC|nr:hypothetical protein [Mucilaginibacter sp. 21P]QXV65392.1 hypothetical protein INP83_20350 [Mucilaginibacter sp. 21P]
MTSFLPQYYELLKRAVIATSGLSNITPHDCRIIAADIIRHTKQSVSETTLKRVFGFAYSKFKPSIFTIDVMAKYCGFKGWEDFCHSQEVKPNKTTLYTTPDWDSLNLNAQKITNFTLQVLRNKSGIPYSQTITRRIVSDHLDDFVNNHYSATVLAAPAGHGKTIALCHWIEERLLNNGAGNNQDVVLFFSTSALMNAFLSGQDINHWLLALLGYTANDDVAAMLNQQREKGGNFYLIIDAFDEHVYKPEQYKLLQAQLLDILALYQGSSWFKLIVTMRSFTWINNRHEFNLNDENWFIRFIGDENSALNVPLFDTGEVRQLASKINQGNTNNISTDIALQFSHPLYFQFYYKQNSQNFCLNNISQVCMYELVSTFILNKIYMGQSSAEKMLLIQGLADEMDIASGNFTVPRAKVNGLIKLYYQAYHELLSIGYLREINKSTGLHYNSFIEFTNQYFQNHALAKSLLYNNNSIFDESLIAQINNLFETNAQKVPVLQWCVLYAFKAGQHCNFDLLTHAKLSLTEKADLINFMGDMFSEQCATQGQSESLRSFFRQDCSPELFNYFFGLEFISLKYKRTLQGLLKFNLSNRKKALIHTALALTAILRFDMNELEECIVKLKALPSESFNRFAINPVKCLDAIYSFLKTGEIKRDVGQELTRFYFNPPKEGNYFTNTASHDMLFLLGAYTLIIFQKPLKTLRYISTLEKNYKNPKVSAQHGYSFIIGLIKADCYYRHGRTVELSESYQLYKALYRQSPETFTDYMKTAFYALRIKINLLEKDYIHIIDNTRAFMDVAGQHNLSKCIMLGTIVNNTELVNVYPEFYKQCRYEFCKLSRELGLLKEVIFPEMTIVQH